MHKQPEYNSYTTGFTLIEVLISMVILALGLLGLAALQGISLKNNQDAYLYSQANALAYEMSDRIKANRPGWLDLLADPTGLTLSPLPDPADLNTICVTGCDSAGGACSPGDMAASDYCYWLQQARAKLSPDAAIRIDTSIGVPPCSGGAPSLCLTMTWSRANQGLTGTTSYQLEVTP